MRTMMVLLAVPAVLAGQMPGVPVLQNAWAAPGVVAAIDASGGSGSNVWAGALAWSPAGRWQVSGGLGVRSTTGSGSHAVYGARVALPLAQMMGGKLGLGVIAGFGGGPRVAADSTTPSSLIPVGVSIGFRQPMGTRGFSVYATPSIQRASGGAGASTAFRVATGLDVGLTKNIGLTGGLEFGQAAGAGKVGTRGHALRHRSLLRAG